MSQLKARHTISNLNASSGYAVRRNSNFNRVIAPELQITSFRKASIRKPSITTLGGKNYQCLF